MPEETCVWEEKGYFPSCPAGTLQAHCCVRWVLSSGKTGQHDHIRDTALPHCFSRGPHAELPAWNKTHSAPGGTAWPVVWGGSETIHGWQGRKTLHCKVSGIGVKASFLYPGTGATSQAGTVPQPASSGCMEGLRWFWDPPLTSCHHQSMGQRPRCADSCCHLCGVGLNLPSLLMAVLSFLLLHWCCMICRNFTVQKILPLVRIQQGCPKCEDTHEQNCLWNRNWNCVLDTC